MTKALLCDNCEAAIDEDAMEARLWWFVIGFGTDAGTSHACSGECAHALIDEMEARRVEIQTDEPADA